MPYQATIYNVMIASPGDVPQEREAARNIILDWNNIHSPTRKIVLLPLGWEHNSSPTSGNRPQEIINQQILVKADILIGIFWTRIGTPTGTAVSGTAEEIAEHLRAGKPAMLYFSKRHVAPDAVDHKQYEALKSLKTEYRGNALTEDFNTLEEFERQFRRHLDMEFNKPIYATKVIASLNTPNEEQDTIRHNLSDEARKMLKKASESAAGEVLKVKFIGGFTFQVGGQQLNTDYSPKNKAKWTDALDQLVTYRLIKETGSKGEVYQVTDLGFSISEKID